jgi:NAD(P)-dependent dehydrogenase (short-subunit alcohol dehydrogenase family)
MMLADRVCVVSGIGPGVGHALARCAAREGASVVLASRNEENLRAVEKELTDAGASALSVPTDITDAAACRRLVDETIERFGRIDVLINNAYQPDPYTRFEDVDLAVWRRIYDVNVFGTLQLTQDTVPHMREQRRGSIVFINSMVIRKMIPQQGGYASSKGALFVAAHSLARELGRYSIRVNTVIPGWIWGPSVKRHAAQRAERENSTVDAIYDDLSRRTSLRRLPTPEDCAEAAIFLASDRAAAITGQALDVNGGEVFA